MKNNINIRRKLSISVLLTFVFALIFFSFSSVNHIVTAEDEKTFTITGSVYAQSGNSDFWLSKGELYFNVQLLDVNNNIIGQSKVDSYGQYVIKFQGNYSKENVFHFNIVSGSSPVVYLFNNFTMDYYLSGLSDVNVNYVNIYIQSYLFSRSLSSNIYNYLPNVISVVGKNGATSSRFGFLDRSIDYVNNFTFDFYLNFSSFISGHENPAFWVNANSSNNTWLFGCGVYAVYTTSTDYYPWTFYFKDNKTGFSTLIYQLHDSDISQSPSFHFRYKVVLINDLPYLYVFFDNSFNTTVLNNFEMVYKSSLPSKISTLVLQSFNSNVSLTYSYTYNNLTVNRDYYANIYNDGYTTGKIDGERIGYSRGFSDGVNSDGYTFNSLIASLVDVPVRFITNLFDVEILGVNLKVFIFSIASVFILTALVKFFIGKFGG